MKNTKGFITIVVAIVLSILLAICLTFISTSSVTTLLAGNISYKEAAIQAADIAFTQAETALNNQANFEANIPGQYFATQQPTDVNGLPTTVVWSQVPTTIVQNYTVQFVTERLCTGTLPILNQLTQCSLYQTAKGNSNKIGSPNYQASNSIYYRVTVQVLGPKQTLTYIQGILAK